MSRQENAGWAFKGVPSFSKTVLIVLKMQPCAKEWSAGPQYVSLHCSNHLPRGILIHPMEDLCLGLLLAGLLGPGS
jgi:hypothetical protein